MINNNSTSTILNLSELILPKIVLPSTIAVISLRSKENNSCCVCYCSCYRATAVASLDPRQTELGWLTSEDNARLNELPHNGVIKNDSRRN